MYYLTINWQTQLFFDIKRIKRLITKEVTRKCYWFDRPNLKGYEWTKWATLTISNLKYRLSVE